MRRLEGPPPCHAPDPGEALPAGLLPGPPAGGAIPRSGQQRIRRRGDVRGGASSPAGWGRKSGERGTTEEQHRA